MLQETRDKLNLHDNIQSQEYTLAYQNESPQYI